MMNPVVYHTEAFNALKTSTRQRDVPKPCLLEYLELLTGVADSTLINGSQFKNIGGVLEFL
eukprot:6028631-Amphidinium_carterae.1